MRNFKDLSHFETFYVVKIHNAFQMAESKPCFYFAHPNPERSPDNARYTPLEFEITVSNQRGATQAAILDVSDQSSLRLHAPVAQPVSARLAAVSSPSARSCCA